MISSSLSILSKQVENPCCCLPATVVFYMTAHEHGGTASEVICIDLGLLSSSSQVVHVQSKRRIRVSSMTTGWGMEHAECRSKEFGETTYPTTRPTARTQGVGAVLGSNHCVIDCYSPPTGEPLPRFWGGSQATCIRKMHLPHHLRNRRVAPPLRSCPLSPASERNGLSRASKNGGRTGRRSVKRSVMDSETSRHFSP